MSSHIHKMLRNRERQAEEAGEPSFEGELLHTRINAEGFVDSADWNIRLTTSAHEQAKPLDSLLNGGGACLSPVPRPLQRAFSASSLPCVPRSADTNSLPVAQSLTPFHSAPAFLDAHIAI